MTRSTALPPRSRVLVIPPDVQHAIFADCAARAPEEACGALIGTIEDYIEATMVHALPNHATHTRTEYLIAGADVKRLEDVSRAQGLSVVGFYHSHPAAPPVPSSRDVDSAWPGYVYVIAGTEEGSPCLQGWKLREDRTGFDRIEVECRS